MIAIAKWTVILFGLYIILTGCIMFFSPLTARGILKKAGSTNFINYAEITLRLIAGLCFILYADFTRFPQAYKFFGWFVFITSIILYFIPRKLHHAYSLKSAEMLKPVYIRLWSPLTVLAGMAIINGVF